MSEQKINNTFLKAHEQLDSLQKVFREGGKLEKAIAESGGDISVMTAVSRALQEASNAIISANAPQTLAESVLDDKDDDGFMARSQLYFMAKDAIALHGMIDDRDDLEPWVHSKIVAASEGMDAVRRYMEYQKMSQPSAEPEMEPEMMTAEASSSRIVREIENLVKQLDSDMNINRHFGDVNIAKVVQLVQAGDIEGAANYAIGEYYDDDGGQNSSVLDGAYEDMISNLNWIVKNVKEVTSPTLAVEESLEEGMEFDEKRTGDLKTVAQDVFKNALSKAKKKSKK